VNCPYERQVLYFAIVASAFVIMPEGPKLHRILLRNEIAFREEADGGMEPATFR